jgi:hypothetical protein
VIAAGELAADGGIVSRYNFRSGSYSRNLRDFIDVNRAMSTTQAAFEKHGLMVNDAAYTNASSLDQLGHNWEPWDKKWWPIVY